MTTLWKYRIMLFVRASDVTPANKQAFADIYVNGGSGETIEDEKKMFNTMVRLSTSGEEPAQAFGVSTAAKLSMRDGFKALLDGLTNARYAIVANTDLLNYADNELMMTNFPITPSGQIVTWNKALNYIENEFGLKVIIPESDI